LVSEITAAMLLVGIVVAVGGPLSLSVSSQLSLQQGGLTSAMQRQGSEAGVSVSTFFASLASTSLTLNVYNYGSTSWVPVQFYVDKQAASYFMKDSVTGNAVTSVLPNEEAVVTLAGPFTSPYKHTVLALDAYGGWTTIST